jgi:membrane protease YdiL (CAAX protease family)
VSTPTLTDPAAYPGCPITVEQALARGRVLREPRWGLPDIAYTLAGAVGFSIIGLLLALFAQEAFDLGLAWALLIGLATPWIALAGWPVLVTTLRGNGPRIDLGLRLTWSDVGWGVLGGVVALIASGLVAALLTVIVGDFDSAAGEVAQEITESGPLLALIIFAVLVAVGAPIVEEIAFRGLIYNSLAKKLLHPAWVITISAIIFAAFHLEPTRLPILLVSGTVFGVLRWFTRGLGAPIVAHAVNNAPGAVFLLVADLLPAG